MNRGRIRQRNDSGCGQVLRHQRTRHRKPDPGRDHPEESVRRRESPDSDVEG